jgi:hypothetical protein
LLSIRKGKGMRGKLLAVPILATMLVVGLAGPASAQPVTMTFHEKDGVSVIHDVLPCVGSGEELGTITTTENGVFHVTAAAIDDQGTPDDPFDDVFTPPSHVTGTFTGTFVAVPDDPSLPTFTGHFTQRFGENTNQKIFTATFTFTVIGHGSDGSTIKFHETAHITVTPNGATMEFDKPSCH